MRPRCLASRCRAQRDCACTLYHEAAALCVTLHARPAPHRPAMQRRQHCFVGGRHRGKPSRNRDVHKVVRKQSALGLHVPHASRLAYPRASACVPLPAWHCHASDTARRGCPAAAPSCAQRCRLQHQRAPWTNQVLAGAPASAAPVPSMTSPSPPQPRRAPLYCSPTPGSAPAAAPAGAANNGAAGRRFPPPPPPARAFPRTTYLVLPALVS